MKDIYENARQIICWLGPLFVSRRSHGEIAILDHLETLYDLYPNQPQPGRDYSNGTMLGPKHKRFSDLDWDALRDLLHMPWWIRAWIVQEATTPKGAGEKRLWFRLLFSSLQALLSRKTECCSSLFPVTLKGIRRCKIITTPTLSP